ncbi:hypothetical protein SNA_15985 [Streptomyces natalensis ATCC 27448]|uniref:Uncharacterized protein n=2 Tax=Streptomyces natalensis TaxID=68242 RepID=A0A0D7CLR2_9ACTN|nr:hypothetical protein SNA_15985 [Streptomyces natalensis ATCC 27448]
MSGLIILAAGVLGGLASPAHAAGGGRSGGQPEFSGPVVLPIVAEALNTTSDLSHVRWNEALLPSPAERF